MSVTITAVRREKRIDLRRIVDQIERTVAEHRLGKPGRYRRWLWQKPGETRDLGLNEYGCADAANILYTINRFPEIASERACWIDTLQNMQDPETGMYSEPSHHPIHCTAHCIAALELFDTRPRHSLKKLSHLEERAALHDFLESLDWEENPWQQSHLGAGIFAARVLAGEASCEWQDWYFSWLWNQADPHTGLWRKNCIRENGAEHLFIHMAGTFHYLFNQEYARRPLRYPDRLVDTCLKIMAEDQKHLLRGAEFADIDLIYCLSRALRQSGHRHDECQAALREYARKYSLMLAEVDFEKNEAWNDLHKLFGATCALAELQSVLPGFIYTERPLRLVLDRRPFI